MNLARRSLLAGGAMALMARAAPAQEPAAGTAIAWPPLKLLDGRVWTPSSWRDTAAVVVFWSMECPYCRRHNARIEQLHRAALGQPLRVLGACHDRDAQAVREHLKAHGLSFPVTLQADALRPLLTARRGIVPLTATVDRRGRLKEAIPGEMAEPDVQALLRLAA